MDGGSDSGDDAATLAELLSFPSRKRASRAPHPVGDGGYSVHSGRRHRRPKRAASKVHFVKGDVVWAKVFPYTWWPGRIVRTKKGSAALVSLFLCNTTRWLQTSQIREFERSYARMLKMVGVKLSEAIELALAEIRLGTASALACRCQCSVRNGDGVPVDRIAEVKKGLDPRGMLDFVLGVAASASIDDSEAVSIIRASAQVISFRCHVSVCPDGGANRVWAGEEETCACGITDILTRPYVHKGAMQLLGDSSIDAAEGSVREVSKTSSEKEIFRGGSRQLGCDFSVDMHDKDGELCLEQAQGCRNICMTNREDFSIIECDEEYETLLHNQLVTVIGLSMEDNVEKQSKSIGSPLQESDVDAESDESFGHETVDNQSVGNQDVFYISNVSTNSLPTPVPNLMQENAADLPSGYIIQSGKDVAFRNTLVTGSETDMEKEHHEHRTSVADTCNSSPESDIDAVCYGRFSSETDDNWNTDSGALFHISEESLGSLCTYNVNHGQAIIGDLLERDHAIHSGNDASLGNILMTNLETEIVGQQDNVMSVEHEISDSASVLASLSGSFLPNIESCKELLIPLASMCSGQSPDEKFDSVTSQSNSEATLVSKSVTADKESTASAISGFLFPLKSSSERSLQKGRDDQAVSCNNSELLKTTEPLPEAVVGASHMKEEQCFTTDETTVVHPLMERSKFLDEAHSDVVNELMMLSSEVVAGASHMKEEHCFTTDENTVVHPVMERSKFLDEANGDVVNELMMPSFEAVAGASHMKKDHCTTTDTNSAIHPVTRRNRFLDTVHNDVKSHSSDNRCIISPESNEKAGNLKSTCSKDIRKHVFRNSLCKKRKTIPSVSSDWKGLYASPLIRDSSESAYKIQKSSITDGSSCTHKSLHIKFPKDFNLPSKEELEKKFGVFGPVDRSRTKVFFYTGSGRVVFLHESDAIAAYRFVKRKNIFGRAKVHFWLDKYEKYRKECGMQDSSVPLKEHFSLEHSSSGVKQCNQDLSTPAADHSSVDLNSHCQESSIHTVGHSPSGLKQCSQDLFTPTAGHSSVDLNSRCQESSVSTVEHSPSNLKSCLKIPNMPMEKDVKKRRKVRFLMVT